MSKFKNFIGIDISKDVFDVMDSSENHYQFHNDLTGFKEFGKILSTRSQYVLECTGFELIDDWKSMLIEEVKNLIISTIHQKDLSEMEPVNIFV